MIPPRFLNAVTWLQLMLEERGRLEAIDLKAARMNAAMRDDVFFPPPILICLAGPVTITFYPERP